MNIELMEPTPELAQRLTATVDDELRLVGLKMAAMGGANPTPLHSLADVANFIHIDEYEVALTDRNATVGYIDPDALARWVEEVLTDTELAGAIRDTAARGEFYGAYAMPMRELLSERLAQCGRALSPADNG